MKKREDIRFIEKFIVDSDLEKKIWRYMSLDKFESILNSSGLYFASAEQFNDNHEGAITEHEYESRKKSISKSSLTEEEKDNYLKSLESAFRPLREYAKINCWHINEHENVAMWNYYQGKGKGIAIETTLKDLLENIGEYRIQDNYGLETINVALVKYIDYVKDSMDDGFGFLTPFLYKRINYAYENEVRLIISLRIAVEFAVKIPKEGIIVPFDYKNGIKRIILSPNSDSDYHEKVKSILDKYNAKIPISNSELSSIPRF